MAVPRCDRRDAPRVLQKLDSLGPDQKFLWTAAQSNLADIEAGRLAETSASDLEVRKLGLRMGENHRQANGELTDLATRKGFRLPTAPDESHQKQRSKLAELRGADFDKRFPAHNGERPSIGRPCRCSRAPPGTARTPTSGILPGSLPRRCWTI